VYELGDKGKGIEMNIMEIAVLGYAFGCIGLIVYFWVKPITSGRERQ